ncbi:hypothetical protein JX265_012364 [Neoarthrinium moseri]|uniref:Heterokaryon incompatibility domain-containing protein n=1 Tax=Neoarthrinium moseri TaxID=1658444 RepID=A0A9P9WAG7_9PEZI|nr:uncharacterized protein JN550_011188 [Neoarthrinium moseri]KAI1851554.1 hypothetical protein JX266_003016 [Neoarthrinium moseri]KAI1855009.1 hypothetical protein JX265_012364 [Neoarthrinium moseri]KAI1860873.1 hypothetical protein JN550_011188 [Neoarthrinium moseri]
MPKLFDALGDLTQGARVAADTAVWLGRYAKRQYNSGKNGVCLLCNNLQPANHENTFVWTSSGAQKIDRFGQSGKAMDKGYALALLLENLSTKELLRSREIDPRTGTFARDCKYCRLICEVFDAFFIDEWMSWVTETKNSMPVSFGLMIRQGAPLIVTTIGFVHDKYLKDARADVEIYCNSAFPPSLAPGLPALGPANIRQADSSSAASMWFIKDCVWECWGKHPACHNVARTFIPTRLLYVGKEDTDLRLCETSTWKDPVAYAALSHCWGGGTPLSLTKDYLEDFKRRVDFSKLPNTFKDAVTVARELQLSYLWIDSLCIIQDKEDKTDWQKEAARMADVYSQAFIVVTTASSPNPETPVIGPREEEWLPKTFKFTAHHDTLTGDDVLIEARKRHILAAPLEQGLLEPPFTSSWATLKRIGPLYNRGWCFQESYLATRNLHFTPGAIVFECKTHRRSEDQLPPYPSTVPGTVGIVDPAEQWRMIVKSFTSRQLTFGTDKMPAIGGAASAMPQARTSRYLAGLWSESLLLDLMWQVMPWLVLSGQESQSLAYEDGNGGPPTWSWASINWGVVWSPLKSPQLVATVLDAQTSVEGVNPYGKVSYGAIRLRGRLRRCQLKSNSALDHDAFYTQVDGTNCRPQHYRTDGPLSYEKEAGQYGTFVRRGRAGPYTNDLQTTAVVFLIACSPLVGHIGKQYAGLVLGTSPRFPTCMERVGAIFGLPKHWYDSAEDSEVTIV